MSIAPVSDADLDEAIRRAERVLADLRRQRADQQDAAFLHQLASAIPLGTVFNVTELQERTVLYPGLAAAIRPMDPHKLGMYLARLARRQTPTDVALERIGKDEHGCCFQLVASS